ESLGRRIEQQRAMRPFESIQDLARRCDARPDDLTSLAFAGAFASFGLQRRAALWQVAHINRSPGPIFDKLPDTSVSPLPEMIPIESTRADYDSAYLTVGAHMMAHHREQLTLRGVASTRDLGRFRHGATVK